MPALSHTTSVREWGKKNDVSESILNFQEGDMTIHHDRTGGKNEA